MGSFIKGLFGSSEKSQSNIPSWLEGVSKTAVTRAEKLVKNDKYTPYKGTMVADKNSYYDRAAKSLQGQRDIAGKAMSGAYSNLRDANALGADTRQAANIYRGMPGEYDALDAGYRDLNSNYGEADSSYNTLPSIIGGAQSRAENLQLGTGDSVRGTLSGAMGGAGSAYDEATGATRSAASMNGTDVAAIAGRMNPYADLVKDKTISDYMRNRAVGANSVNDAAKAAGAFGGSRHGVAQAAFDRQTSEGVGDIATRANADAFNAALAQLNADRASGLSSAAQLADIQGRRDSSTLGYTSAMSDSAARDAGLIRQGGLDRMGAEQARAQGLSSTAAGRANLLQGREGLIAGKGNAAAGLSNMEDKLFDRELQYSDALTKIGAADQASRQAMAADQLGYGKELRGISQDKLDAKYQQYQDKERYPYEQLNWLTSIAGGQPYSKTTTTTKKDGIGNSLIGGIGTVLGGILSDEDKKENREPADGEEALRAFREMPVDNYDYTEEAVDEYDVPEGRRVGPMAQDFAEYFGGDGKTIDYAQYLGALAAAVKALEARTRDDDDEEEEEAPRRSSLPIKRAA